MKLRVPDRPALLRRLARLHARPDGVRVHEMNTLYDRPDSALRRAGQVLRIRATHPAPVSADGKALGKSRRATDTEGGMAWLTFKRPAPRQGRGANAPRYKIREEREVRLSDAETSAAILRALGFEPVFRYEKYRSTFRLPGPREAKIELDETPIGDFLEVEAQCAAIDRAAALLGYAPADYITKSYGELFLEGREMPRSAKTRKMSAPSALRDMLFPKTRRFRAL